MANSDRSAGRAREVLRWWRIGDATAARVLYEDLQGRRE